MVEATVSGKKMFEINRERERESVWELSALPAPANYYGKYLPTLSIVINPEIVL